MGAGFSHGQTMMYGCMSGWWFGTWLLFSHILGIMIPTDFHIFQRGRYTTNQIWIFMDRWSPKNGMGMGLWSIYDMQVGSRWFISILSRSMGNISAVEWVYKPAYCWRASHRIMDFFRETLLKAPVATKDGKTWYRASASVSNEQDEKWSYGFLAACQLAFYGDPQKKRLRW